MNLQDYIKVSNAYISNLNNAKYVFDKNELMEAVSKFENIVVSQRVDLQGETITIPENVVITFLKGGLIDNGELIINGEIKGGLFQIFGDSLSIAGIPQIEAVYPEWFGAIGKGRLKTAQDLNRDVTNIKYPEKFYTNSLSPFSNPTGNERPFENTDSIDSIAIQRAVWLASISKSKKVCLTGDYVLNIPVIFIIGDAISVEGTGVSSVSFYNADDMTSFRYRFDLISDEDERSLFIYYRGDGKKKEIKNIKLIGSFGYSEISETKFKLIQCLNVNGLYLNNCWLSSASYGVNLKINCTDIHLSNFTSEYLFDSTIEIDNSCKYIYIENANIWGTQAADGSQYRSNGVNSASDNVFIRNSEFILLLGNAIKVNSNCIISNCNIHKYDNFTSLTAIDVNENCIISNCIVDGYTQVAMIKTKGNNRIVNNIFIQNGNVGILNLNSDVVGGCENVVVSNNLFQHNGTFIDTNTTFAIQDTVNGVSYTGAVGGAIITNNNFIGANAKIHGLENAVIKNNYFSIETNEIQSPNGHYEAVLGIKTVNNNSLTIANVSLKPFRGVFLKIVVNGVISGIGEVLIDGEYYITYNGTNATITTKTYNKNGNVTAIGYIDIELIDNLDNIDINIKNAYANDFNFNATIEANGETREKIYILN